MRLAAARRAVPARGKTRGGVPLIPLCNDLMELDTRKPTATKQAVPDGTDDYNVDVIVDDTGSRAAGTKKHLVRWLG